MRNRFVVIGVCIVAVHAAAQTMEVRQEQHHLLSLHLPNKMTMQFVRIPRGEFLMGSPKDEEGHKRDEEPVHPVKITSAFYIGAYEVTEEQFEAVTGRKPPIPRGSGGPALGMTWKQTQDFCKQLSKITGRPCRLPTEAEWEYACRAGSISRYWFGDSRASLLLNDWCGKNSGDEPKPIGTKKANPWGLYDMHGNALEWCVDWYAPYRPDRLQDPSGPLTGKFRVARGGSFFRYPNDCRSATRSKFDPEYSGGTIGFRVVIASSTKILPTQQVSPQITGIRTNTYTNEKYRFTIQFPNGWTIKDGVASGTIVNAVYRDESGKVAMITINAQRLAEGEGHSFRNTSPEEVFELVKRQFTGRGIRMALLDSGLTYINGEYSVWHKYRMKMPQVIDKTFLTYNIPRKENLFIVSGSANPEIYPKVESILKESIASLHFDSDYQSPNFHITKPEESWLTSFLMGFGKILLFVLAMSAIVGIGKYILAKSKRKMGK
ncbi:MAG: SUMF1/EgtB/PvdO family nonheme iron enzyme [Planctomycetes bacterium]|nr:SUMF1/EgtB/PvdO family nonheme iron enzyme [Planctomycetota bacterium]